jgi:hypothetical protein
MEMMLRQIAAGAGLLARDIMKRGMSLRDRPHPAKGGLCRLTIDK